MPLRVKPIRVKQSVYFRVPNDIADLIGVDRDSDVILTLEETRDDYLLTYRVRKIPNARDAPILSLQRQMGSR